MSQEAQECEDPASGANLEAAHSVLHNVWLVYTCEQAIIGKLATTTQLGEGMFYVGQIFVGKIIFPSGN